MGVPSEVAESLGRIIAAMNSVSIEKLDIVLAGIGRDEAIGPMVDPTAWQDNRFDVSRQTKKIIQAIRDFKVEVSGIGNFEPVPDPSCRTT